MKNFKLLCLMTSTIFVYSGAQDMSLEQAQQALTKITKEGIFFDEKQVVSFYSDDTKIAIVKLVLGKDKAEKLTEGANLSQAQKTAILLDKYDKLYATPLTSAQSYLGAGLFVGTIAAVVTYIYFYGSQDTDSPQEEIE